MARRATARRRGVALLAFAVLAAACSDKKDEGGAATEATVPVATAAPATSGAGASTSSAPAETAAPTTADVAAVTTGGTLRVSGEAEVTNPWTPAAMQCDPFCTLRARTFFDPLAVLGADHLAHPFLAESITSNPDYTEWTVKLRSGISFTDGTPVDADAAIKNLQTTGASLLVAAALTDLAKNPDGSLWIDKVDDLTFTVHTGKGGDRNQPLPWPGFATAFTTQWALIASPAWFDAVAAKTADPAKPVGSGPFVVESYAPRDKLVVTRNPGYWRKDAAGRQLPYLDRIEFRVIEDPETAHQALSSGDIDVFSTSSATVIKDMRDDGTALIEQPNFQDTGYLLIDLDKPGPLQDRRVRCALSKAIDRQEVIDAVAGGIGVPANGLFSPGQEGHLDDNGFDPAQDVEGARQLIADYQADHPGEAITIHYGTVTAGYLAQLAELLKGYWTQLDVQTDYEQVPQDAFITNALFGAPDFYMYSWRSHAGTFVDEQNYWWNSVNAAPDGQLALNFGRLRDPVVDDNLAIARSSADPAVRRQAAEAINGRMAEQCYQIPLSWGLWAVAHGEKMHGVDSAPIPDGSIFETAEAFAGLYPLATAWIEK